MLDTMAAINYSKYIVRKSFVAEKFYGRFLFQTGFSEHEIAVLFTKVSQLISLVRDLARSPFTFELVTFTPCLVLVKPRKSWTYD